MLRATQRKNWTTSTTTLQSCPTSWCPGKVTRTSTPEVLWQSKQEGGNLYRWCCQPIIQGHRPWTIETILGGLIFQLFEIASQKNKVKCWRCWHTTNNVVADKWLLLFELLKWRTCQLPSWGWFKERFSRQLAGPLASHFSRESLSATFHSLNSNSLQS